MRGYGRISFSLLSTRSLNSHVESKFSWCQRSIQGNRYFDSFRRNLYKYIYRRPEVREWLLTLREQGCRLFLVTNSHFDYTDLLLSYSFGEDWRSLFDISIVYAQKPSFFKNFNSFKGFLCMSSHLWLFQQLSMSQRLLSFMMRSISVNSNDTEYTGKGTGLT